MKKTLTVNLNNTVYHIDNDAFEVLQQYLNDVESRLSPAERKEVIADIEARISELFTERLAKGKNVVTLDDVEEVITILGKPNQYSEDEESQTQEPHVRKRPKRKFYRDVDNGVIGGVAAGLAAFLGWDVVVIRIIFVLLVIIGYGTIIPIYILIWIIAPGAVTIGQKLEMQGEDVTAERIKSEINNLKNYVESDKFKESASSVGNRLGTVIGGIFKVVAGVIGAIMGFVGFLLLGALLLVLSFMIFEPSFISGFTPEFQMLTTQKAIMMVIALLLIVGIPIFMLIYWAIRIISGKGKSRPALSWLMVALWIVGIIMFAGLSARTLYNASRGDWMVWNWNWTIDDNEPQRTEYRVVEPFNSVEVRGNIQLELVQSDQTNLQVTASPTALSNLTTRVSEGVLMIYTDRLQVNRPVTVNLSGPQFESIAVHGASKVESFGKIRAEQMLLEVSGASRADLDLLVSQDLRINVSGASRAEVEGVAYKVVTNISGTSRLDAKDLTVRTAKVEGSGASQLQMAVTDSLTVNVSGATSFKNAYRPEYIRQRQSGASKVTLN